MKAQLDIVYTENRHDGDTESNLVAVGIHRWKCGFVVDVILTATVIVDGEPVVSKKTALSEYWSAADLQRHGIKVFDELLLSHPVLSPEAQASS